MCVVFHFTSADRLPAILRDGFLLPTEYDPPEITREPLVWATTCEHGDLTSKGVQRFRLFGEALVRFTLSKRGFVSWAALRRQRLQEVEADEFTDIDADDVEACFDDHELAAIVLREPDYHAWHVHRGPVPIRRARAVEIMTRAGDWLSININELGAHAIRTKGETRALAGTGLNP